jgi:hypothetical protein
VIDAVGPWAFFAESGESHVQHAAVVIALILGIPQSAIGIKADARRAAQTGGVGLESTGKSYLAGHDDLPWSVRAARSKSTR